MVTPIEAVKGAWTRAQAKHAREQEAWNARWKINATGRLASEVMGDKMTAAQAYARTLAINPLAFLYAPSLSDSELILNAVANGASKQVALE